jgi:cytoskeletal protein RodZ
MFGFLQCRKIGAWMVPYLTGDLEPEARRIEFEQHVQQCERCRVQVAEKRQKLHELLAGEQAPESLQEALEELGVSARPNQLLRWTMVVAMIGVLLVSAYVWRLANPVQNLLGPKAASTLAGQEEPEESTYVDIPDKSTTAEPTESTVAAADDESPPQVDKPDEPGPPKATVQKPKLTVKHPAPSAVGKPAATSHTPRGKAAVEKPSEPVKRSPTTEVEVFDPSGKVVGRAGKKLPE